MSSINSLLNAGSSSVTGNAVANSAVNKISEKISDIENDTSKSDEYKQKQIDKLSSQLSTASNVQANIANASSLINGMLGKTDVVDFSYFFGSDVSTIRTLMNANMQTQKEARVLASEISLDKIRGCDTSDKEEKLSNMSANMSISNNSLNSKINSVLADEKTDKDTRAVIDRIKDSLAAEQKKLDKEFGHTSEDDKTSEDKKTEGTSDSSTQATKEKTAAEKEYDRIHKPSVIDQIKSGLEDNQKKLDEEFNGKA